MKKLLILLTVLTTVCCLSFSAFASDDIFDVNAEIQFGQTEARGMLPQINELRKPANAWYWNSTDTQKLTFNNLNNIVYDYELEQIAMQRAAEIAIHYSHTRPNGEKCFTAYDSYLTAGENIAYGYTTAQSVFEAWAEESEDYAGQGHRRNMLSSDFTAVGIGHAVVNGRHFWVQEFRAPTGSTTPTTAINGTKTMTVEINKNSFTPVIRPATRTIRLNRGESVSIDADVLINNVSVTTDLNYSVANPSVAVASNGRITALAAGSTTITISAGNGSATINVEVASSQSSEKLYSVAYNSNGGSGSMSHSVHTYNVSKALNTNTFTRSGYTFLGWSTNSSAKTPTYTDGQVVKNLTSVNNSTVTLYAVWKSSTPVISANSSYTAEIQTAYATKYYTFTPTASGEYVIYSIGSSDTEVALYDSADTKLAEDDDGGYNTNFRLQYYLTAGTTYSFGIKYYGSATGSITFRFGNIFTVSYNGNGGTGAPSTQHKDYGTNIALSSSAPSKTGFIFKGWATSSSATTATYSPGAEYSANTNVTLYAVWSHNTSELTANASYSTTVSTGNEIKYFMFTPTASGEYVIYSTGSSDTEVYLHASSGTQLAFNDDGGNSTNFRLQYYLTAGTTYRFGIKYHYSTTTGTISFRFGRAYNIVYGANGGTGVPSAQTKDYGANLTLSSVIPTRPGYSFLGWAPGRTATSAVYAAGATYSVNGNAALYAVWKPNTYSVIYSANGGKGTMANSRHSYGVAKPLNANTFTRPGYTFLGWAQSRNATAPLYTDMQSILNLTSADGRTLALYAVWKPNTYTIIYSANGGRGTMTNSIHTYGIAKSLNTNAFTRPGYTFLGWAQSRNASTPAYTNRQSILNLTSGNGRTLALYAVWKPNTYSVIYSANGGKGTMTNSVHTYGVAKTLNANAFTRAGYTFLGWSTSRNSTTPTYTNRQSIVNLTSVNGKTLALYAVWKPNTYTIIYSANGGTGTMSNSVHTYGTAKALSANTFTRHGYTFLGWSTSRNAKTPTYTNRQSIVNLTSVNGKTLALYAVWKPNTYTIIYSANGGTGTMSNSVHTYGTAKALSANTFTRHGYTFLGWSTSRNAKTPTYTNRQNVVNITNVNGKTLALYAVWKKN